VGIIRMATCKVEVEREFLTGLIQDRLQKLESAAR
jgi:hypothetical protein